METFNLVVMLQRSESNIDDNVWLGTVLTIKKHISEQVQELKRILFVNKNESDIKIDEKI